MINLRIYSCNATHNDATYYNDATDATYSNCNATQLLTLLDTGPKPGVTRRFVPASGGGGLGTSNPHKNQLRNHVYKQQYLH